MLDVGTGANKSGASDSDPVNLRLATPDDGDTLGELFVENVVKRSGGSIRIQMITGAYSNRLPANESKLARALQQGLVDIGYLPARAWAVEGLPDVQGLLVFVMTTDLAAGTLPRRAAEQILETLPRLSSVSRSCRPSPRILRPEPRSRPPRSLTCALHIDNPQSAAAFVL